MAEKNSKHSKKRMAPREKAPEKNPSFFQKVGGFFKRTGIAIARFFKELKGEMGKISWYSRRATVRNSVLVIVTIALVTAVVGLLDWGISVGIMAIANNIAI